jgi:hypothetical protein
MRAHVGAVTLDPRVLRPGISVLLSLPLLAKSSTTMGLSAAAAVRVLALSGGAKR